MKKLQEYNPGHSLRCPGFTHPRLVTLLSQIPEVSFTKKRRLFTWNREDKTAEFLFMGQRFMIEPDQWDDTLWILPTDKGEHRREFQRIKAHFKDSGITVESNTDPNSPPISDHDYSFWFLAGSVGVGVALLIVRRC